ncbi:MAG: 3-deoxy-manno-octulosonate cytidylyltransferase [Deltaproteobacteria bacterium]|nr:3-deoxy-manno-octulosonate cytidylyltransferase [Deltaproteobacteria bacterium]MBW1919275.1 3-deoxy-manno-octulosonate cytidylyltransferase [Deltaproteobacteria bacterium]MBW1935096.1 3-deoxy-manno-octulosonate cytidylyltransferase [Deltaproteobacteria bacterium]MBW1977644.1 3-deoxy-manno-octulosonate cytidylyltransferase [Deltaproteobacteria bacterium]MBW2044982.1 3-deoxy-manno-octulosonate cytidylyltransferase [Deltaproteobacteria bacterium]
MKILAFIPARYGSTRFPGKPLALIAGRPLVQRVYECALSCPEISDVFVATDDERISECVQSIGGKAIMTSKNHRSGTDRIAEAAKSLPLEQETLIINIQGDQPAFKPALISDLIKPLLEDSRVVMTTLKFRIKDLREVENPNYVKVVTDRQGFALFFSRSPIPFFRDADSGTVHFKHLGFYGYRLNFLNEFTNLPVGRLESAEKLEQLRALENGFKIRVVETQLDSVEVDTPEDIVRVEEILGRQAP